MDLKFRLCGTSLILIGLVASWGFSIPTFAQDDRGESEPVIPSEEDFNSPREATTPAPGKP